MSNQARDPRAFFYELSRVPIGDTCGLSGHRSRRKLGSVPNGDTQYLGRFALETSNIHACGKASPRRECT